MSTPNIKIKVKTTPAYNANINIGGTNSHYITYDAWNELVEQTLNPRYVTKEDFDAFQNQLPTKYITEETLNQRINSLNIPKKLTDLDIDLNLVKYDPDKDYLEVIEH